MEENKNETVIEKEQESQKTFTEEQVLTLIDVIVNFPL